MSRNVLTLQRAVAAGLLAASTGAWADPPLQSETADAIERGKCQLELALARLRASGLPTLSASDALFSCGVAARTQAAMGYTRSRVDGSTDEALRVAGKTNLVEIEAGHAGWGLRYGVEWARSAGSGWRADTLEVLGVYSRELAGGVLMHANLGHSHSRVAGQGTTTWSLGIEKPGTLTWAADVSGDDRDRPGISAGLGYALGGGFSVNAVAAWQFTQPRVRGLILGAKLEF